MICSKVNLLQELINANVKPCDIESINVFHQAVFVRLKDETHEDKIHFTDILGCAPPISFGGVTWQTVTNATSNTIGFSNPFRISWDDLATAATMSTNNTWTTATTSNSWATLNRTEREYWYGA